VQKAGRRQVCFPKVANSEGRGTAPRANWSGGTSEEVRRDIYKVLVHSISRLVVAKKGK